MNLVTFKGRFDFKGEDGRPVRGCKLVYLLDAIKEEDQVGAKALEISAPYELFETLKVVPGYYELKFEARPQRGGRPVAVLVGADYVAPSEMMIGDGKGAVKA